MHTAAIQPLTENRTKALLIVHVEEMFRRNASFMLKRLVETIRSGEYGRIVAFVHDELIEELADLHREGLIDQTVSWSWGYVPAMFRDHDQRRWCIKSQGHEFTYVPDELRRPYDWRNTDINVCGGAYGECLADMESVLDYVGFPYNLLTHLVY